MQSSQISHATATHHFRLKTWHQFAEHGICWSRQALSLVLVPPQPHPHDTDAMTTTSAPPASAWPAPGAPGAVSQDPASIIQGISARAHFTRDRALQTLRRALPAMSPGDVSALCVALAPLLEAEGAWEPVCGALQAARLVLAEADMEVHGDAVRSLAVTALPMTFPLVAHSEARVRSATSALIGTLAGCLGVVVWEQAGHHLLDNVAANFELDQEQRLREAARVAQQDIDAAAADAKLHGLRMVHETEGWRGLETTLLAVADLLKGCGADLLAPCADSGDYAPVPGVTLLVSYMLRAKDHPNRFVREAGLRLLTEVVRAASATTPSSSLLVETLAESVLVVVMEGLQDNWSQVRFAASVAVRAVLTGIHQDARRVLYPKLLPRMCLNRHYVAEGVRVYSQETWKSVIADDGKLFLVRHLEESIAFYEQQCTADNHAVREAACQSLGEATTRLDASAVVKFVPRVVEGLVVCFKDESWPVRDHACRALADVVFSFGAEVEGTGRLEELYGLFHAHLADNIVSVRKNTARAIVRASLAFDATHAVLGLDRLCQAAIELLPSVEKQEEKKYGSDSSLRPDRDTGYGAASKLARDNDVELHTDQVMYSCGSLAPKLRRGGGCMDHGFSRPREPWEETDGGVLLWRSIADANKHGAEWASSCLSMVVSAATTACRKEFAHSAHLQESLWVEIAAAAPSLDSDAWTIEVLSDLVPLFEQTRRSESKRTASAASAAMGAVRRAAGFRAYLEAEKSSRS